MEGVNQGAVLRDCFFRFFAPIVALTLRWRFKCVNKFWGRRAIEVLLWNTLSATQNMFLLFVCRTKQYGEVPCSAIVCDNFLSQGLELPGKTHVPSLTHTSPRPKRTHHKQHAQNHDTANLTTKLAYPDYLLYLKFSVAILSVDFSRKPFSTLSLRQLRHVHLHGISPCVAHWWWDKV